MIIEFQFRVQGVPSDEEDAEGSDSDVEVYSKVSWFLTSTWCSMNVFHE